MPRSATQRALPFIVLGALIVVGVIALVVFGGRSDEDYSLRRVVPLASGELLLVERSGFDNNTLDHARLRVVGRDGTVVRTSDGIKGAYRVYARTGDRVWGSTHADGLHMRGVADLAVVPGTKEAIAGHDMLAPGDHVLGTHDGAIVVKGADQRYYTIDNDNKIERHGKDMEFDPLPKTDEDTARIVGGHAADIGGHFVDLSKLDLVDPKFLVDASAEPMHAPDDAGVFVYSVDRRGKGSSAMVSLLDKQGKLRWTVAARDLMNVQFDGKPGYRVVWAQMHDDRLWLALEVNLWMYDSEYGGYGQYEVHLAVLDPATGDTVQTHPIIDPATRS